jgi:pectate lyase
MPTKTKRASKKYTVIIEINGVKITKKTDDIKATLLSLKPEILYLGIYLTVKNGKDVITRNLNLIQTKRLFANEDVMDIFIMNLNLN